MRTNIMLDDNLIKQAFKFTPVRTKRELIEIALREFVENHKRLDIRELRGKIKLREDYDYKALRKNRSLKDEE